MNIYACTDGYRLKELTNEPKLKQLINKSLMSNVIMDDSF